MATAASSDTTRLPRQIRERAERANAILAESQAAKGDTPPITAEVPQPGEPAANPPTPPAELTPTDDAPRPELKPFHDLALATDPRAADPMYWRNRLSVMDGMRKEERRSADARESALREKVSDLEEQIRALKAAGTPATVDVKSMFTPEQLEALGEDQAAAIATAAVKAARTNVDQVLAEQRTAAEAQRTQAQEQAAARQRREFLDNLEELVPNWPSINARQDWLQWLTEIDPTTGQQRQAALTQGEQAADVRAVAGVFQAFLRTLEPRAKPPVAAPSDAAPVAASQASAVADRSMTPPTQAEIKEFYKQASIGKVSDADRLAFEKRCALL